MVFLNPGFVVQDWLAVSWCLEGSGGCWALSSSSDHLHLKSVERCQLKTINYQDITLWRQDLRLGYEAVGQIISAALCDDLCPCDLISCDLLWWLRHGHHPREQACHIPHVDGECCYQVLCLD